MRSFKQSIAELDAEIERVSFELKQLTTARESLQNICKHDWKYDGHGHNDDHYICTECGADKWE